jgi:regulator of cell morphogenesis and NO signaling
MMFDPRMTVNELLRQRPETQEVLDRYHVDYCCGGNYTLEEAAEKGGFDLGVFLRDLEEAVRAASSR